MSMIDLPARATGGTTTTVAASVNLAAGASGGFVIDGYGDTDYKMVRLDQATGTVVLGAPHPQQDRRRRHLRRLARRPESTTSSSSPCSARP